MHPHTVSAHGGEVNDAGDGDDQQADDDGGHRHVQRHPAQPPGAVVVSPRVAVPGLGESAQRFGRQLGQQIQLFGVG